VSASPAPLPGPEDIFARLRGMSEFRDLLGVQAQLQAATVDPSVGDPNALRDRIDELRSQILSKVDITPQTFDRFVRQEAGLAVDIPTDPLLNRTAADAALTRRAANVLGAGMGLVEDPLALAGDSWRTFLANLAEEQGKRAGVPPGLLTGAQTGTFQGSPAPDPITAVMEMSQAAWQTGRDLGFVGEPLRAQDPMTGESRWNPENGWVVYAPDLVWDRYRAGVSSYEADLAVTGYDFNERFKIAERLGVESEKGKQLLGIATEIFTDPWLAADFLFAGGKALRAAGTVTRVDSVVNAGRSLEQAGERFYQALSPVGVVRGVTGAVRREPTGIVDAVFNAVGQGTNNAVRALLDMEIPFGTSALVPERQRVAAGVLGYGQEGIPKPRVRDLLFQRGRVEGMEGNPLELITGGEQFGVGAADMAIATQRNIQSIAARGTREVADALTRGLTRKAPFRAPWMKLSIPSATQLIPEHAGFVRTMGAIVSDFVSTRGAILPKNQIPREFGIRLRAAAEMYNQPVDEVISRFRDAATAARKITLETGYEISGYRYFTEAMRNVAARTGVDPVDLRRAYEKFVGNVDIQRLELEDVFTRNPAAQAAEAGAELGTAGGNKRVRDIMDGWIADPPSFRQLEEAIQTELGRLGREDLRGISPASYLAGIRNGYLPRMFQGVENPQAAYNALHDRSIITMRNMDLNAIGKEFAAEFGGEAGKAARQFLTAQGPRGQGATSGSAVAFTTDDLARVVSARAGREVTGAEVADLIYRNDDNYKFLEETLELLRRPAASSAGGGGLGSGGAPWAMTPGAFAARQDFDAEDLARRVLVRDPVRQTSEVGLRGGRQLRAQEFIGRVAAGLEQMGVVVPANQVPGGVSSTGSEFIFKFQSADGVPYVALPNKPQVWGPLANKGIPEEVARMVVYASDFGRANGRGTYERLLGMFRTSLLSPLSTSVRNLVSNFLLIQRAGGDLTDMLTTLPEANRVRRQYLETGRLPEEFRGFEELIGSFTADNTMTSTAVRSMDDALEQVARGGSNGRRTLEAMLDNAENFVDWSTSNPAIGALTLGGTGMLGLFRWGEETSRMTTFMTTYRRLISRGVDRSEAASRAAHFAQNAAFNYGAAPLLPDMLRRSGLSAFPQFSYFATARTARAVLERPATIQRLEYARQAANVAAEPDLSDQESLTAMSADWLRYSKPLVLPIPGRDGEYYMFNMQYWLPEGDLLTSLLEPTQGGVLSPLVDAVYAWRDGTGQGPFGAKYGIEYFDPAAGPGERAAQTAGSLAQQFVFPGVFRQVDRITEAVAYNQNRDLYDMFALAQGRFYDSDWSQVALSTIGLSPRRVSTRANAPSFIARARDIERKYQDKISSLRAQIREVVAVRDENSAARYNELSQRLIRLEMEKAAEEMKLMRLVR